MKIELSIEGFLLSSTIFPRANVISFISVFVSSKIWHRTRRMLSHSLLSSGSLDTKVINSSFRYSKLLATASVLFSFCASFLSSFKSLICYSCSFRVISNSSFSFVTVLRVWIRFDSSSLFTEVIISLDSDMLVKDLRSSAGVEVFGSSSGRSSCRTIGLISYREAIATLTRSSMEPDPAGNKSSIAFTIDFASL